MKVCEGAKEVSESQLKEGVEHTMSAVRSWPPIVEKSQNNDARGGKSRWTNREEMAITPRQLRRVYHRQRTHPALGWHVAQPRLASRALVPLRLELPMARADARVRRRDEGREAHLHQVGGGGGRSGGGAAEDVRF